MKMSNFLKRQNQQKCFYSFRSDFSHLVDSTNNNPRRSAADRSKKYIGDSPAHTVPQYFPISESTITTLQPPGGYQIVSLKLTTDTLKDTHIIESILKVIGVHFFNKQRTSATQHKREK